MVARRTVIGFAVAATLGVGASGASASTFTSTTPLTIPAGAPTTTQGPASSYPSTINVAGSPGNVADVNVTSMALLRGEAGKDTLKGQGGKDSCVGRSEPDKAKSCEKQKSI